MTLRTTMLAVFICALVACSGGQLMPTFNSSPSASSDSARSIQLSPALAQLVQRYPQFAEQLKPLSANPFACTATPERIPGVYAEILAFDGTVSGTSFTTHPSDLTAWFLGRFVKATPAPTPSPGTTPTPKVTPTPVVTAPPGQPLYFYIGSYQLNKYGHGCAFLITSVNGKKIKKEQSNALAVGTPTFRGDTMIVPKTIQEGPLTMHVTNLSANGGKGSVVLLNAAGHGANMDTGTITFTDRIELKP
jgi:hypothetical protein